MGSCWFLSCLNVHVAFVPRLNSWCLMCSLFPEHPHMPMPVYTTRRPSIPEPSLPMKAHTETPNMRVRSRSTSPLSSPKVSLCPPVDLLVSRKCRLLTPLSRHANPVSGLIAWLCSREPRVPAKSASKVPRLAPRSMGWNTTRHHPSILRRTPVLLSATHWQTVPKCPSRLQARTVPRCP